MTVSADKVVVAGPATGTGGVRVAVDGTALPITAAASLAAAWHDLGYVGENGVTQSIGTDTNKIRAWGGDIVRTVQTSHELTYQFDLIELNDYTLEEFYGNAAGGVVEIDGTQPTGHPWIIDMLDGTNRIRIVIPDGQITDRGDVVYNGSDAAALPVTLSCYPDASGNKAYMYTGAAS
jgi:hypothetical protein